MIWCFIVVLVLYSFLNQFMIGILAFIIVFRAISYLRPSKEWGELLFYTRRSLAEKIFMAISVGYVLYIMMDAAQNGWSDSTLYLGNPTGAIWFAWLRMIILLIALVMEFLPDRVFENGFRDGIRFEAWDCVESMEFQENDCVKITLKKPTLRRTAYLHLKPGDELPMAALERGKSI